MSDSTITGDEGAPAEQTLGALVRNNLGWSFANNVSGRSLTFISSLVLARLLVPREFGVFAIALVVYSLLISLNDVGIYATIVRWPGDIDEVAPTATTLIFLTSLVVYGVFFVAAPYLCQLVGAPDAAGVTRLLCLAIVVDGIFAVPTGMLTRYYQQNRLAVADLVNSVVATVVSILLALHGHGVWSLAWGRLLGNLVGAILCTWFSKRRYRPGFKVDAAKKLVRSGAPLLGTSAVTIGVFNVDYLTIGRILGPTALGYYVLAFNVSSWAISIFSFAIDRVSIPTFARLRGNPEALRATFIRGMTLLCLVTFPVCALMAALNHPLVLFMYGSRWAPSTDALEFLAIFAVVRIIQDLAMDTLIAVGNSMSTLVLQSCWLIVLIPTLILGAHLDGITGVAIGHLVVGFLVVTPIYTLVIQRLGVSLRSLLKHLAWPLVGGVLGAFAARTAADHFHTPFVGLVVGGLCGLLVYSLAILPTRRILSSSSDVLEIEHAFPLETPAPAPAPSEAVHEKAGRGRPDLEEGGVPLPDARDLLSEVDASPVWFGPRDRLLFGWLHVPGDNAARAGVVLCESLGIEGRRAHVAYRVLAAALARQGFLVLRFDYDGTGDSVGSEKDPDRVAAWGASIRHALRFLEEAGATRRIVVGMRVGATIAVNAGVDPGLDALVLWDPCVSGGRYIRESQMLLKMIDRSAGAVEAGVELPGHLLTSETAADLSSLRLESLPTALARKLLVLERPGRSLEARARHRLSDLGAEWAEATGQSELLEAISPRDTPPLAAISTICTWLDRGVDTTRHPVRRPPTPKRAVVGHTAHGESVTERVALIGPVGLVGVITESEQVTIGPLVILLNDGHEHHVGPARLWVELARRWAALGVASVRVDVSGIGDSPLRPGQIERVCYPPEIFDDIAHVASDLRPDDPRDVVLIGVCSGAYHAIDCGIYLGVRGICAINPGLSHRPRGVRRSGPRTLPRAAALLGSIHPRLSHALLLMVAQASPKRSAAGAFFLLEQQGTTSLLICGDDEAHQFQRLAHWNRTLRRLTSGGNFRFENVRDLEHSLLNARQREAASSLVTEFVLSLTVGHPPLDDDATDRRGAGPPADSRAPAAGVQAPA
jgi:O-antigen/teichoic acid export membrane protein/alpha-beta hydrolase superfamily lysophospholipase